MWGQRCDSHAHGCLLALEPTDFSLADCRSPLLRSDRFCGAQNPRFSERIHRHPVRISGGGCRALCKAGRLCKRTPFGSCCLTQTCTAGSLAVLKSGGLEVWEVWKSGKSGSPEGLVSRRLFAQGQCDAMDFPRCLTSLMASAGPARTLRVDRVVPNCAASAP